MRILLFALLATSTGILMSDSPSHIHRKPPVNPTDQVKQKANEGQANPPVTAGNGTKVTVGDGTNQNTAPQKQSWLNFGTTEVKLAASGGLAVATYLLYSSCWPVAVLAGLSAAVIGVDGYLEVESHTDSLQQKLIQTLPAVVVGSAIVLLGTATNNKEEE